MLGTRIMRAFEEIKDAFDPKGLLNPGKIVRAPRFDDRKLFRFQPGYKTVDFDILEGFEARRLIVEDNAICGLLAVGPAGPALLAASGVVIATGGIGGLFEESTNPLGSFGQGVALAARAGAALADMEFVQFHPTALDVARRPMPLVSEAVRGAGATLIDETGQRFMARYARRGIGAARRGRARDLAPARARPSRVPGRAQSDRG